MPSSPQPGQDGDGTGNKRKRDDQQPDSSSKRAAPQACLSCRSRKVRCDVTIQGQPCTNCRLDNLGCVLGKPRRAATSRTGNTTSDRSNTGEDFPVSLTFEGLEDVSQDDARQGGRDNIPGVAHIQLPLNPPGDCTQTLPKYIRSLSPHLKPIDTEYLTGKGCLRIPDDDLQRELFRLYILYIHPFMPVVDLPDFLTSVARRDASSQVSLLLFQAIMFAAVVYIDSDYCTERGYENRKAMRKEFFEKVRLLYHLDTEPDRIARLQALLLMTYWYERADDEKDTWHWTGIALSQIHVMGIHRSPEQLGISPKAKRGRKRIWWSCYVRDRLLALGIRRPARIRPETFNVPDLTIEDLDMEPFDDAVTSFLGNPQMTDSATQRGLMLCFLELTKLCVHIGDILFSQYSVLNNDISKVDEKITMMIVPKKSAQQMQDMEKCDLKLRDWMENLEPPCRYKAGQSRETAQGHSALHLHQALLHMIYLTSTAILHRPQAQRLDDSSGDDITTRRSADKIADAAGGITQVAYDLHQRDQLRFASTSAIPALLSAILIHLNDIASSRQDARYASIGQFYQCWQAIQSLRDMYASADHVIWFLEAVIQRTNVSIPMLNLAPSKNSRRQKPLQRKQRVKKGHVETEMVSQATKTGVRTALNASNSLITPETMGAVSGGTQSLGESSTLLPLDAVNMESQFFIDPWTDFDAEANLLQALVHFDADPNFFPVTNTGPQEREILPLQSTYY
ncbi:cutinase transcription factor 1 beta [Fusarium pseudoanthophilum]|uniref:Cutinase transcription factor 1 beta n=1 Tax=Fusarium pseudoanthophilum TaxID=48495 RepID=A0A8H5UW69_9HYPO|nr:cutinase transcription factor 1 beta [Fusarium pseudoanthophilum]